MTVHIVSFSLRLYTSVHPRVVLVPFELVLTLLEPVVVLLESFPDIFEALRCSLRATVVIFELSSIRNIIALPGLVLLPTHPVYTRGLRAGPRVTEYKFNKEFC